jgi:hypothetical protein
MNIESIDKSRCWLLDLVCENKFPLSILREDKLAMIVNRSTEHGLSNTELVNTVELLFEEGMLVANLYDNPKDFAVTIHPKRRDIEDAIAGKLEIHYGLTALGGKYWETVYKPNWKFFVTGWSHDDIASFSGSDRDIVEQYLLLLPYRSQQRVVLGSASWEPQTPYPATYWKALPSGWRVTFKVGESDIGLGIEMPPEYQELNDLINSWYTNPFESNEYL